MILEWNERIIWTTYGTHYFYRISGDGTRGFQATRQRNDWEGIGGVEFLTDARVPVLADAIQLCVDSEAESENS